jgi:betaine-aldehyde dehydrogenase
MPKELVYIPFMNQHPTPTELVAGVLSEAEVELPGVLENPDDGTSLGHQRASSPESVERALAAADAAWHEGNWSALPVAERAAALERLAQALIPRAEEIATLDSIDSGVPISVTRLVAASIPGTISAIAAEAIAVGESRDLRAPNRRVEVMRLPWGPALLLTPWNAPAAAAAGKVGNALAAGCPAILKPSEHAPSFTRAFGEAAIEAELPTGALQIVQGDGAVASRLVVDDRVRTIALTGGQATGRAVVAAVGPRMVPLQLELGGTNPAVVARDADPLAAAAALADGITKLNGQWCEAPRRVLVARSLYDELVEALIDTLSSRVVGPAREEATEIGPLANSSHLQRVRAQLEGLGGRQRQTAPIPDRGFFFSPTVVLDPPSGEVGEIFGPVVTVQAVADDREAIALANGQGDGLAGYVFSADPERAFKLGRQLEVGEVRIGGTNLIDLSPDSTQSFWGATGVGSHGAREVFESFRGSRIVGEEDPTLPL